MAMMPKFGLFFVVFFISVVLNFGVFFFLGLFSKEPVYRG